MIVEEYDEKEFFDKSIKMLEKDYGNNFANDFKELYIKQQEEIERLNNIINKAYKYLDEKKDVPEWWDTDFMMCMDILKGGTGCLKDILENELKGEDK